MKTNVIYNEECLEGMKKKITDDSIDLIVTDPPYNIGKAEWDKIDNYIQWCGEWLKQCERVLKDNGSFYFWHNDFEVLAELQRWINKNTNFIFRQMIVWNKRFNNAKNKGFLDGFVEVGNLRNYQKMAEYCLFYTLQPNFEEFLNDVDKFSNLRNYSRKILKINNLTLRQANVMLGHRKAEHFFYWNSTQWRLCSKETYRELQKQLKGVDIPYESLKKQYEKYREEYKKLKYTYNNQKTHHSVWNYEIAEKQGHITPKPIPIIENIIKHSSNKNDIVLDCFGGSGTTAKACQNLNRKYILFEKEKEYVKLTKDRLRQQSLFASVK